MVSFFEHVLYFSNWLQKYEIFYKGTKIELETSKISLSLSKFDFTLKYISGTKIEEADRLSRRPDWKIETVENR